MILFVFEGEEREPRLYRTLERLYFPKQNDNIVLSFGNNLYELYNELQEYGAGADLVPILRQRLACRGCATLDGVRASDISQIFLFFDYDFQNSQLPLEEINKRVKEMLALFDDETENGKLYINYPMVESIWYTKELPDEAYARYTVSREDCKDFKRLAREFSAYKSLDHILFKEEENMTKDKFLKVKDNWQYLKSMNVRKANLLTTGLYAMPATKSAVSQQAIFDSQVAQDVRPKEQVAVLNAFPIFIYDYMK